MLQLKKLVNRKLFLVCICFFGHSTIDWDWSLGCLLLQLRKVVSVNLSVFFLYLKQVSLLSLVVPLPLPLPLRIFLQHFLCVLQLLLQGSHSCLQIIIDVLLNHLVLPLLYALQTLELPDVEIDLCVSRGDGILEESQFQISLMLLVLSLQGLDGPFVHLDLSIAVF